MNVLNIFKVPIYTKKGCQIHSKNSQTRTIVDTEPL